ncbi:haloacid dehalogenase [Priestia megaterium]|nr:haloacid dehalogenase [Priestia megaterium]
MTNVILFNFNGTIVDTKAVAIDAYNEIAEKQGYKKIAKQDICSLRSLSIRERCKILQVPLYKMPLIGIAIKRRYQQYLPSLTPVAEMMECLEDLKQHGYQLGFTTSNNRDMTQSFLLNNEMNIFDYTDYTTTPFSKSKDIRHFIRVNHLNKEDVLYVGDELRDIKAAQKEGVRCIAASWGYDSDNLLQSANALHVISNPSELSDLLIKKSKLKSK